jgi:hypothetical protein
MSTSRWDLKEKIVRMWQNEEIASKFRGLLFVVMTKLFWLA